MLLPSGYALGIDGVAFAGGIAAITERIKLLLAVRCGEMWPPQLARQLAGLDEMLGGRLTDQHHQLGPARARSSRATRVTPARSR